MVENMEKLSEHQLIVLGILLGLIAQAVYDTFKLWLTPLLLEGRHLTASESMNALIPALAGGLSVLMLFLIFYRLWRK